MSMKSPFTEEGKRLESGCRRQGWQMGMGSEADFEALARDIYSVNSLPLKGSPGFPSEPQNE
ncbi:MAG: hypothetical protein ACI9R3_001203 [Verrucomicrobiales bacterium]|jgi:hypothetical protein